MNFLDSLSLNPPVALKPDRPASSHMLSWEQFQLNQASDGKRKQREQQLMQQQEQLIGTLRDRERDFAQQYQKYLQQLLLHQIENQRLRHILSEWDAQRKRFEERSKELEGAYQHRLQLLKIELSRSFQAQLQALSQQNNSELEQVRQLYNRRLAQNASENNTYEDSIEKMRLELQRKGTRIQILQASNQDVLLRFQVKSKQCKERDGEINVMREQIRVLTEDEQMNREQRFIQSQRQKQQISQLGRQNEQLKDQLEILKGTIEEMREQVNFAQMERVRSHQKKEKYVVRCLALEKEIDDFKSRKTQHNNMSDLNNRSVTGVKHSPHHSFKAIEGKMGQDDRLKDSRNVEHQLQIQELSSRILQLQDLLKSTKEDLGIAEEKIREHNEIVNRDKIWAERLSSMQKALEDLNQEWLKKERELGSLFKGIELNYLAKLQEREKELIEVEKALKEKEGECQQLANTLAEKAIQLGLMQSKKK